MIDADGYLTELAGRLHADGCAVSNEPLGLVGYQAHFRALTRVHVFLVAAKTGAVDENLGRAFAHDVVNLAVARKGQWRGFQSGVIVLPVLVAASADAGAVRLTQRALRLNLGGFAVLAQPAIVDLAAGTSHIFRGTRIWGFAYNSLIKQKLARYLPDPA